MNVLTLMLASILVAIGFGLVTRALDRKDVELDPKAGLRTLLQQYSAYLACVAIVGGMAASMVFTIFRTPSEPPIGAAVAELRASGRAFVQLERHVNNEAWQNPAREITVFTDARSVLVDSIAEPLSGDWQSRVSDTATTMKTCAVPTRVWREGLEILAEVQNPLDRLLGTAQERTKQADHSSVRLDRIEEEHLTTIAHARAAAVMLRDVDPAAAARPYAPPGTGARPLLAIIAGLALVTGVFLAFRGFLPIHAWRRDPDRPDGYPLARSEDNEHLFLTEPVRRMLGPTSHSASDRLLLSAVAIGAAFGLVRESRPPAMKPERAAHAALIASNDPVVIVDELAAMVTDGLSSTRRSIEVALGELESKEARAVEAARSAIETATAKLRDSAIARATADVETVAQAIRALTGEPTESPIQAFHRVVEADPRPAWNELAVAGRFDALERSIQVRADEIREAAKDALELLSLPGDALRRLSAWPEDAVPAELKRELEASLGGTETLGGTEIGDPTALTRLVESTVERERHDAATMASAAFLDDIDRRYETLKIAAIGYDEEDEEALVLAAWCEQWFNGSLVGRSDPPPWPIRGPPADDADLPPAGHGGPGGGGGDSDSAITRALLIDSTAEERRTSLGGRTLGPSEDSIAAARERLRPLIATGPSTRAYRQLAREFTALKSADAPTFKSLFDAARELANATPDPKTPAITSTPTEGASGRAIAYTNRIARASARSTSLQFVQLARPPNGSIALAAMESTFRPCTIGPNVPTMVAEFQSTVFHDIRRAHEQRIRFQPDPVADLRHQVVVSGPEWDRVHSLPGSGPSELRRTWQDTARPHVAHARSTPYTKRLAQAGQAAKLRRLGGSNVTSSLNRLRRASIMGGVGAGSSPSNDPIRIPVVGLDHSISADGKMVTIKLVMEDGARETVTELPVSLALRAIRFAADESRLLYTMIQDPGTPGLWLHLAHPTIEATRTEYRFEQLDLFVDRFTWDLRTRTHARINFTWMESLYSFAEAKRSQTIADELGRDHRALNPYDQELELLRDNLKEHFSRFKSILTQDVVPSHLSTNLDRYRPESVDAVYAELKKPGPLNLDALEDRIERQAIAWFERLPRAPFDVEELRRNLDLEPAYAEAIPLSMVYEPDFEHSIEAYTMQALAATLRFADRVAFSDLRARRSSRADARRLSASYGIEFALDAGWEFGQLAADEIHETVVKKASDSQHDSRILHECRQFILLQRVVRAALDDRFDKRFDFDSILDLEARLRPAGPGNLVDPKLRMVFSGRIDRIGSGAGVRHEKELLAFVRDAHKATQMARGDYEDELPAGFEYRGLPSESADSSTPGFWLEIVPINPTNPITP